VAGAETPVIGRAEVALLVLRVVNRDKRALPEYLSRRTINPGAMPGEVRAHRCSTAA